MKNRLGVLLSIGLALVALALMAGVAESQAPPQYAAINPTIVFGADEILGGFGVVPEYDELDSDSTFYNSQVIYKNGTFYLWTQTGWKGAGCVNSFDGLDNVIVSKNTNPAALFRPVNSSGSLSQSEMRASMATDSQADNACDDNWMWGIGDVIEYPSAGQYIATFDLSKQGSTLNDHAKFFFYFAESNGAGRLFSKPMHKFLDVSSVVPGQNQKIIVEPVVYKMDPGSNWGVTCTSPPFQFTCQLLIGFMYQHCNASDFSGCNWNYGEIRGHSAFPSFFNTFIRDQNGILRDTGADRKVTFAMGSIPNPGGFLNSIVSINGQKVAFYDKGTKLGYREMETDSYDRFKSWGSTERIVKDGNGLDLVFSVSSDFDIRYPAVVEDGSGDLHLFYAQNTTNKPAFRGVDIVHRDLVLQ